MTENAWLDRGVAVLAFVGTALIGALIGAYVQRAEAIRSAQWQAKKQACVEALDVIDAYFTTLTWATEGKVRPVHGVQKVNIRQIRRVFNRLAVSVTDPNVLDLYGKAFNLEIVPGQVAPPMSMAVLTALRNAIRKELFGAAPIEINLAWIFNVNTACTDDDPGCPPVDKDK